MERARADSFTREQTEAIKRAVGYDEFYPNFWEVQQAGEIFRAEFAKQLPSAERGENSIETIIGIAASKVWSAARRYQSGKPTAVHGRKPDQGRGRIARLFDLLPFRARA